MVREIAKPSQNQVHSLCTILTPTHLFSLNASIQAASHFRVSFFSHNWTSQILLTHFLHFVTVFSEGIYSSERRQRNSEISTETQCRIVFWVLDLVTFRALFFLTSQSQDLIEHLKLCNCWSLRQLVIDCDPIVFTLLILEVGFTL
ncbi:hypothetical protein GmHk_01G002366 [Glycine max]|nr:hypothetical protein GmHk_01G002366 [Glycine max]KAH1267037.1 hypothetical protein GmHk_01G002366 [Glycine max]